MRIVLGVVAVATVCVLTLWPKDEPKYQDVYLSEWLRRYAASATTPSDRNEAEAAILAIGTNGLPYFLECLRYQRPSWRSTVADWLPRGIQSKSMVFGWRLDVRGQERARSGVNGFRILGSNAVSTIPELKTMLTDRSNPEATDRSLEALVFVGEESIPVLEAAFSDPQQVNRWYILWAFKEMVRGGYTNRCLPKLVGALTHSDVNVRVAATNFVGVLAPQYLTNAPAH